MKYKIGQKINADRLESKEEGTGKGFAKSYDRKANVVYSTKNNVAGSIIAADKEKLYVQTPTGVEIIEIAKFLIIIVPIIEQFIIAIKSLWKSIFSKKKK